MTANGVAQLLFYLVVLLALATIAVQALGIGRV